jgi:hypothetical protein
MRFPVYLPAKRVVCNELSLNHYKDLLKASYGDEPSYDVFIMTVNKILLEVIEEPIEFLENLSLLEVYLLLLKLRIQSMGDSAKIVVTQEEKQTTIELNLEQIYQDLFEYLIEFDNKYIESNNTKLSFKIPSLKKLLSEQNFDNYFLFFNSITIKNNKTLVFDTLTESQIFFDKLPAKLSSKFISFYETASKNLQQLNLIEHYNIDNAVLTFNLTIDSFIWFTKLLFNESLESFYNNIFYLSYLGHLSSTYLENSCTPGEYIYFVKKMQETLALKNSKSSNTNSADEYFEGNSSTVPDDLKDS